MPLSRTVSLGFIGAALALSSWTGCLQNSKPEESCSKEEVGPRDSTLIYNRKWLPTDTTTPDGFRRWEKYAMYITSDSILYNGSKELYSRSVEYFECSNRHPDTCYTQRHKEMFYHSGSFMWTGGWVGGGPGDWEFTKVTPDRLSLRTQKKKNSSEWNCTETFQSTTRVFADTLGGTLKIYP